MEINQASWHAAWFRWACRSLDRSWPRGAYRESRYHRRTDLCTYFRTTILGTLAAAYSLAAWLAIVGVLTVLPIWLFGIANMLMTLLAIVLLFSVIAGVVWIVTEGFPRAARRARDGIVRAATLARDGTPTAVGLVVERMRAAAGRYCPTITFRSNSNDL